LGVPVLSPERLVVALVRGVHGLRGAVRVEILTDRPEDRYAPGSVLHREGDEAPLTITWSSPVADGPGWRLQFAEVRDRPTAETLKDGYLEIAVGPDAALPRGAYFWHEVIGARVVDVDGTELGTVRDVYRSGGAEVYTVTGGPYGEFDVPGVRDFVRIFAPRRGEIVVDVEALDLAPPRRDRGGERPKAPRRRAGPRRPKAASAPVEAPEAGGTMVVPAPSGGPEPELAAAEAPPEPPPDAAEPRPEAAEPAPDR
jgi:16S rRNA processing protein RimM